MFRRLLMQTKNKKIKESKHYEFETLQLYAGYDSSKNCNAAAVPIYQTTSYTFENTTEAAQLFALQKQGYIYTRINNPTITVFEDRMAALEGGTSALACSSGMAAQFICIAALAQNGSHIVASSYLYGGSTVQFKNTLSRFGIKTDFIQSEKIKDYEKKINKNTKAIYVESIGNPKMNIADISTLADLAHKHNIPLIVDNTFGAGGYLCNPIASGADIVIHSATKWIGGHGTSIGGIIINAGKFNWKNEKFPHLTQPSPHFNNISFVREFKNEAFIIFARVSILRNLGPALSPLNAFLLLQGIETLSLRAERHSTNAYTLAKHLKNHKKVRNVWYPGLEDSPYYPLAKKYFKRNLFGGMLAFETKGGIKSGKTFIESCSFIHHLANVGDSKTLAIHPASTTHSQLSKQELEKTGISPSMIRISVGTEHIDDIIYDFENALKHI